MKKLEINISKWRLLKMSNLQTASLLKKLRIDYNYTIQNIATLLGVSKAAVSKWEKGDDIKTENLYELSKVYGVTFSELYYGKLNDEDNNSYWRRNYDLSNFELEEDINTKNVENLKILFDHCTMVKERFLDLMPKWAKDELNFNEQEEFSFIKKYFKFDINYYAYIKYGPRYLAFAQDKEEKEFIIQTLEKIKNLKGENYKWELRKLYDFNYDYKSDVICQSGSLKALEYMLSSLSQIEKDSVLYANLHIEEEKEIETNFGFDFHKSKQLTERDRTVEEIEDIPYFKIMINSGAHKLYQHKSFNNVWDKEMLEHIDGNMTEIDNSIYNKYQFSNNAGKTSIPILNNWKLFSYRDYLEFIDEAGTNQLKDIVNLKDSNPKKYYERMIERECLKTNINYNESSKKGGRIL